MKIKLTILLLTLFASSFSFGQNSNDTTVTKTYTYSVVNLSGVEDLNVDTTITGFHFAANFQGTIVFTKNGAPDINTINPTAFSFTIASNMSSSIAKDQLNMLLNLSKQNGYKITELVQKDTTFKNNNAYYISYIETDDKNKYKNLVFNAFVIKDNTLILFTSGDLDNGQYIDKFKKTFYSIKL